MPQSMIISSGSEASDDDDSHLVNADKSKPATRIRRRRVQEGTQRFSSSGGRASRNRRSSVSKNNSKHFVEHNYHDHLHDPMPNQPEAYETADHHDNTCEEECTQRRRGGHRGGVAVPFPEKLHFMLSQMDPCDTAHIVAWQPHGRCFVVHKPKEFVEDIMPK